MGGTGEGIAAAGAGAEVPIGTVAMKTALMEVAVTAAEGMTIVIIMKVEAGGTEAQVQAVGGVKAQAQVAGGIVVPLGKEVKRDELKLNSGIGRRKRQNVPARQMLGARIVELKMTVEIITEARSNCNRMDMGIDDIGTGLFSISAHHLSVFVHSEFFF